MTNAKKSKGLVVLRQEEVIILDKVIESINKVSSKNSKLKACLIALILLFGGSFACKKNATIEKAPTNIEQLVEKEGPEVIVATPSPNLTTILSPTPMNTNFTTPEATSSPIQIILLDDDVSNVNATEVLENLNKLYLPEFNISGFPYSEDNIVIIKMAFGDFSNFQNYYDSVGEGESWNRKKEEIFRAVRKFLLDASWTMVSRNNQTLREDGFVAGSLDLCSRFDDSMAGKETLVIIEKMTTELYDNFINKDELTKKAQTLQDNIYKIYYGAPGLDENFLYYNDMHPIIQMAFVYYISQFALTDIGVIAPVLNSLPKSGEECYDAIELHRSFDVELQRLMVIMSEYIDNYLVS